MAEPGFLSAHAATSGTAFVQNTPDPQTVNGESAVAAGALMSIDPLNGAAYRCGLGTRHDLPAGFAAADHPAPDHSDDTTKLTLVRQGRIRGFYGLVPGALYYPSSTPGAIVPERGLGGPVITAVAATSGSGFLRRVLIRAGHRPIEGDWTITFPTATTCRITPPGGTPGPSVTVAASTVYDGTIAGAEDFSLETRTLTSGNSATITVSYDTPASAFATLDSPETAITAVEALPGAARVITPGLYTLVTTASTVTIAHNGSTASPAIPVSAGSIRCDLIPGVAVTFAAGSIAATTTYILVGAQAFAAPAGIAVNATTLQITLGGID